MSDAPHFSHVDGAGNPGMVDISHKEPSTRVAVAEARVVFPTEALLALRQMTWTTTKGPVAHTAIIAGTQAAKRTADLLPFCHPLPLERCRLEVLDTDDGLRIRCEVATNSKTGVEMEAWTAASVAALTVVDMCKALSPAIRVTDVHLVSKTGGKSDYAADPS